MAGSGGAAHLRVGGDVLAAAHARLLADRSFQFDLPVYVPPVEPGWLKALGRVMAAIARALSPYATELRWGFWALVALVVLALLLLAARCARPASRLAHADRGATLLQSGGWGPSAARAQALLWEADRLAGEGRFGEAVRVLLHRTLADLETQRPGLLSPAQTSREIAALPVLPEAARQPLGAIARAVERFTFAGPRRRRRRLRRLPRPITSAGRRPPPHERRRRVGRSRTRAGVPGGPSGWWAGRWRRSACSCWR